MSGVPSGMDAWGWIVLILLAVVLIALPIGVVSMLVTMRSASWSPPPPTRIAELVEAVEDLNVDRGTDNGLDQRAAYAAAALEDLQYNNGPAAVRKLELFIAEVEAQSPDQLSESAATDLIALAQTIIDTLTD